MISRWNSPILARGIASSAVLSPKAFARAYEDKAKDESAKNPQDKPPDDPWAPVFDDIPDNAPPIPSVPHRHDLHPRFFTSRPGPKMFFNSNTARHHAPSGPRKREYGTDAKDRGSSSGSNNNNPAPSAWDHVFDGIDDTPPSSAPWPQAPLASASKFPVTSTRRAPRRQPMTAREISAFDDMFDMIFTAVSKKKESGEQAMDQARQASQVKQADGEDNSYVDASSSPASTATPFPSTAASVTASTPETPASPQSIGRTPSGETFDLFGKLRRHSNRMRRTSATDELLDRKKEEMELCDTDQDLLDWAMRELHLDAPDPPPPSDPSSELARYLADPTFPHVLAHLMYTFRTKYQDPHTALALFSHVKRRSTHSYVFGCTTPAYNELLEARWILDGNLKGIEDALAEMRTNGISTDKRTGTFVERIRREVGERMLGRPEDDPEDNVWDALSRVEGYVKRKGNVGSARGKISRLDAKRQHWNEEWKTQDEDFKLGQDRLSLRP